METLEAAMKYSSKLAPWQKWQHGACSVIESTGDSCNSNLTEEKGAMSVVCEPRIKKPTPKSLDESVLKVSNCYLGLCENQHEGRNVSLAIS